MRIMKEGSAGKYREPVVNINSTGIVMASEKYKTPQSKKRPCPGYSHSEQTAPTKNFSEEDQSELMKKIISRPTMFGGLSLPRQREEDLRQIILPKKDIFGAGFIKPVNPVTGKPMASNDPRTIVQKKEPQGTIANRISQAEASFYGDQSLKILKKLQAEALVLKQQRQRQFGIPSQSTISFGNQSNNSSRQSSPQKASPFNPFLKSQKKGEKQNILDKALAQSSKNLDTVQPSPPKQVKPTQPKNPIICQARKYHYELPTQPPANPIHPHQKYWQQKLHNVPKAFQSNPANSLIQMQKKTEQKAVQKPDQTQVPLRSQFAANNPPSLMNQNPQQMSQAEFQRNYCAQVNNLNSQMNQIQQQQQAILASYQNNRHQVQQVAQTNMNSQPPRIVNPAEQKKVEEIRLENQSTRNLKFPGSSVFFERLARSISAQKGQSIPDFYGCYNRIIPSKLQLLDDALTQNFLYQKQIYLDKISKEPIEQDPDFNNQTVGQFLKQLQETIGKSYKIAQECCDCAQSRLATKDQRASQYKMLEKVSKYFKQVGQVQEILGQMESKQDEIERILDLLSKQFIITVVQNNKRQGSKSAQNVSNHDPLKRLRDTKSDDPDDIMTKHGINRNGQYSELILSIVEHEDLEDKIYQQWNQLPESQMQTKQEQEWFDDLVSIYGRLESLEGEVKAMDSELDRAIMCMNRQQEKENLEIYPKRLTPSDQDEGEEFKCIVQKLQSAEFPLRKRKLLFFN